MLTSYGNDGLTFDVADSGGDGEAVLLLHGFPQSRTCWDGLTPHLVDAGYRVLAPDQRGYSPGARPRRRRDYAAAFACAPCWLLNSRSANTPPTC